jgi:hypothetical protein
LFSTFALKSFSQSLTTGNGKFEIGLGLGPLFFLGDLGGNPGLGKGTWLKDVSFPLVKLNKGLYLNFYPREWIGFRLGFNQGKLDGYDSVIKSKGGLEEYRKMRNLQFQTNLWEAYGAIEFYPTVFFEKYDGLQGKFRPYGVIGVGAFKFNPKGKYYAPNGIAQWVELKPLRLEGQGFAEYPNRKEYSLTQLEIPMGFGFKYYLKENLYIGLEILHRQTFTDYIDDASTAYIDPSLFANYLTPEQTAQAIQLNYRIGYQPNVPGSTRLGLDNQRADATQNDAFFSSIFRLGWRLNQNSAALRQLRCPSFY